MRDRLDGIAVFVEVVEAGDFSRAAGTLALTRSAVGKTIARLEARLGVRLFHRTTRKQALTEEGQIYFERCQRALDELRTGQALLETGRQEVAGRLRISMPVLFGRHCVTSILLDLARQHPKLELNLSFSDSRIDLIADGFDLAIRNSKPGKGSGYTARKLVDQPKTLCAAPAYLRANGTPASINDLANHEALLYWRTDQVHPWLLASSDGQTVQIPVSGRLRFDDNEAIVDAAIAGLGIAWVPAWLVREHMRSGALVNVLPGLPSKPVESYAVWPQAQFLPMRLRQTIDALASRLPAMVAH